MAAATQQIGNLAAVQWVVSRDAYYKLAAMFATSWILLVTAAFLYTEQADRYADGHFAAVMRQLFYETPFQPLFLVVALVPIYVAAARNVPWIALAAGGLMMISVALPFARFELLDVNAIVGSDPVDSVHNSLFQLAGPGHEMPQFVSAVTLLLMAGVVAMFWQPRVGGLIGLMGVIALAFVWDAALNDPPAEDGALKINFIDGALQYGYYMAWAGAVIGILGEWALQLRHRMIRQRMERAGTSP